MFSENNNHALQVITVEQLHALKRLGLVVVQDTFSPNAWKAACYSRRYPEDWSASGIWNSQIGASIKKQADLAEASGIDFGTTPWLITIQDDLH